MAVYNGERYLKRAIESILNQSFDMFEFIIFDDGSTDHSQQIIAGYNDERIRLIINEQNIGLTRSLNKGLQIAQGKYVARQDADDWSHSDRFAKQVHFLENHPKTTVLGTHFEHVDQYGLTHRNSPEWGSSETIHSELIKWNVVGHGTVMFQREAILALGGYREGFRTVQDYDLWLRVAETGRIEILPEILYYHMDNPDGVSVSKQWLQRHYVILCKDLAAIRRSGNDDGEEYRRRIAYIDENVRNAKGFRLGMLRAYSTHHYKQALGHRRHKRYALMLRHLLLSFLMLPLNPDVLDSFRTKITGNG